MRTKTLLIAAAALAAGIMSSQAQVYSQNIVGYVNQVLPGGNAFSLITVPLTGSTNAEQAFPCLQVGDNIFVWTGTGYNIYNYAGVNGAGPGLDWFDPNFNGEVGPVLAPGQAIFYQNAQGTAETNTFVGTAQLTNTVTLLGGNAFALVGTTPPIGGVLDSTNINLPLQVGDNVFIWNGSGYTIYSYAGVNGAGPGQNWFDPNFNPLSSPSLVVGQGFFYQNAQGGNETWTNNLTVQ